MRALSKNRTVSTAAILTLALGIGATTSVFSVVDPVLLRPLPYRDPSRLVSLQPVERNDPSPGTSLIEFEQWRAAKSLRDLSIFYRNFGVSRVTLTGAAEPESVQAGFTSANLFPLLGVAPAVGRAFTLEEERRGEAVAILSDALFERRFARSTLALEKTIEIEGRSFRVIGVMPAGFDFPAKNVALWAPITTNTYWPLRAQDHFIFRWDVVARLRDGVSLRAAQSEMDAMYSHLTSQDPRFSGRSISVVPLHIELRGTTRTSLLMLLGAVLFVLLIACTNVAGLMLARGAGRSQEMAIRAALGAGRMRLTRQLLTECLVLALAAGAAGLALAWAGIRMIVAFGPHDVPNMETAHLDASALAFALAITVLSAILFGLAPSLGTSRLAVGRAYRARTTRQVRGPLVIVEVAFAVMLLAGAGLLVRSFLRVRAVDPGFQPSHALTLTVSFPRSFHDPSFYQRAVERLASVPGIDSAGAAGSVLMDPNAARNNGFRVIEGRAPEPSDQWTFLQWTAIDGDFFRAMGTPLLSGRFFTAQDGPDAPPVAIVNETLARRYWPGENPVGKRFKGQDARGRNDDWVTVVGLVRDMRRQELEKRPIAEVFEAQSQSLQSANTLVVRTRSDPAKMAAIARGAVRSVNPSVVIASVRTLEDQVDDLLAGRRLETWLLGLFSAAALLLAAIGLYGLLHYTVAQRTHEIGVRIALGAESRHIRNLVLREGLTLALTGAAAGLAGAWWLARMIGSLLYGVSTADPASFLGAAGALVLVALIAVAIPARRAARVDPVAALRNE